MRVVSGVHDRDAVNQQAHRFRCQEANNANLYDGRREGLTSRGWRKSMKTLWRSKLKYRTLIVAELSLEAVAQYVRCTRYHAMRSTKLWPRQQHQKRSQPQSGSSFNTSIVQQSSHIPVPRNSLLDTSYSSVVSIVFCSSINVRGVRKTKQNTSTNHPSAHIYAVRLTGT